MAYNVKSAYDFLVSNLVHGVQPTSEEVKAFGLIWKSLAPLKVVIFSWQLLQGRLSTKDNLFRRRVLGANVDLNCVLCGSHIESSSHLFLLCSFTVTLGSHLQLGWDQCPLLWIDCFCSSEFW